MVDSVSAETRIKELLEASRNCTYPEDATGIKLRYKDTALILFRQYQEENNPKNYLSFGTRRSSSVSQYGNTPIVVRRSRSSNGELSTVVEQVSSIRGRSSISDYTLVEARENDDEDSETEDELDTTKIKNVIGENESVADSVSIDPKDSDKLGDNGKHIDEDEVSKKSEVSGKTDSTLLQKKVKGINGLQAHDSENRKSFSHYDLPLQRFKDNGEVETKGCKGERKEQEENDSKVEETDDEITLETEGLVNKDDDNESHIFSHDRKDSISPQKAKDDHIKVYHQESDSKTNIETNESQRFSKKTAMSQSSEVDHEAVLRDYVQKSSYKNKQLFKEQNEICQSSSFNEKPSNDFTFVELKIIEPCDNTLKQTDTGKEGFISDKEKSLTADILNCDDDDDVIFIDASSPIPSRTKSRCESYTESSQELHEVEGSAKHWSMINAITPPECQVKSPAESSPPMLERSPKMESAEYLKEDGVEYVDKPSELENHSSFLNLPIRSPTPPKRSLRSPRIPKRKDKHKQCHSSLVLPLDDEVQESIPKGIRSASPTSKVKDTRFFSFSLKREKSKSASSLSSKRGKDRDKIFALKYKGEDPGVINPVLVKDLNVDGQLETFGKRVGVRSMVIDGTIKRNFIVIHPSDDSETIGLAPLSSSASNKGHSSINTSLALSSVKSHIVGVKSDQLESLTRISYKGGLKEELSDVSKNDGGSLTLGYFSRSLRTKKSKKNVEHKILESSQSLSSEPTKSSFTDSQILLKSPLASSEDCDSFEISAQQLNDDTSRTVSKLCAIM